MTDRLGRLGIRSAQILFVVALSSVVVLALIQLKLVVIPVLIALILASAAGPVVYGLRRRQVPAALATWITLLTGALLFGGIITLIVLAVRNQWKELAVAASDGVTVALDLRLDEGLRLRGRVYDLIHTVNTMRKKAGLELTDRIRLTLPEADADLLEHTDWIARETLAVSVVADGSELRIAKI